MKGIVFDIKRYAVHDGPGIRTTVFFKGCPLNCWWCHNPEGIDPRPQDMAVGRPREPRSRRIGREMTVEEVIAELAKEVIFHDESGGGVTFSGGEPLMQPVFLTALANACRTQGWHTTLDTCGHGAASDLEALRGKVDLFLYDIKLLETEAHRRYTGMDNRLILDNLRRLDDWGERVIVRFPVIPGITDTDDNLARLADLLGGFSRPHPVELLKYHRLAEGKYRRLGRPDRMRSAAAPPAAEGKPLERVRRFLRSCGVTVDTGGRHE